jgi:hypothetical protein
METDTYAPQQTYTFQDVWAAIMEDRKRVEEMRKETDRRIEENAKAWKESRENWEATTERMDESARRLDKTMGKISNRFGELVEHLVAPDINEKFNALGYHFDDISGTRKIISHDGHTAEIDVFLANGEFAIAIEVKSRPNDEDIQDHVKRMEILRRHLDKHHDTRRLQGAIAGAIMSDSVRNYARKTGFYVIEQSGDTVKIDIPPNFRAREW